MMETYNRTEYLTHLAEKNGVPLRLVQAWAHFLGESQDFDNLVTVTENEAEIISRKMRIEP